MHGQSRNIHVLKQREINLLAVRAAPAVPAVATLLYWPLCLRARSSRAAGGGGAICVVC